MQIFSERRFHLKAHFLSITVTQKNIDGEF